jgi:hypothetical protein
VEAVRATAVTHALLTNAPRWSSDVEDRRTTVERWSEVDAVAACDDPGNCPSIAPNEHPNEWSDHVCSFSRFVGASASGLSLICESPMLEGGESLHLEL